MLGKYVQEKLIVAFAISAIGYYVHVLLKPSLVEFSIPAKLESRCKIYQYEQNVYGFIVSQNM